MASGRRVSVLYKKVRTPAVKAVGIFFIRPSKLHEPERHSSIKGLEVETSEKFLSNVILRIPTLFVERARI